MAELRGSAVPATIPSPAAAPTAYPTRDRTRGCRSISPPGWSPAATPRGHPGRCNATLSGFQSDFEQVEGSAHADTLTGGSGRPAPRRWASISTSRSTGGDLAWTTLDDLAGQDVLI